MANILAFLKMKDLYLLGSAAVLKREGNVEWRRFDHAETARGREITDLVERRAGGSIRVEFNENNRPLYACIVEVPEEKREVLLEPPVAVMYTGSLPRVRKNDPELKLAAKVWEGFRRDYAAKQVSADTTL